MAGFRLTGTKIQFYNFFFFLRENQIGCRYVRDLGDTNEILRLLFLRVPLFIVSGLNHLRSPDLELAS